MDNRKLLASRITAARKAQYRSVTEAHAAAGISRGAWDNLERGGAAKSQTYTAVEKALDWPLGTCEEILAGHSDRTVQEEIADSNLSAKAKAEILRLLEQEGSGGEDEGNASTTRPA